MYIHFIYFEKKWSEYVDDYDSIGRLTHRISEKLSKNVRDIYLMDELKTKILDPSEPIIFLKKPLAECDECKINIMERQKGGGFFGKFFKILFLIFLFQFLMVSGIFPMFSKLYTTFIDFILDGFKKGVQYLFKSKTGIIIYMVDGIVMILKLILQIFSTVLFIYGLTAYIAITIFSIFKPRNYCAALRNGKKVAKITTITYMIFYIFLNIINWGFFYTGEIAGNIPIIGIIAEPTFLKLSEVFDKLKMIPFMFLPYVGSVLNFYFKGVDIGMNQIQLFDNYLKRIVNNPTNIAGILQQFPQLQIMIKNNKLEKIFDFLQVSFMSPSELAKQNISAVQLAASTLAKNVFLGIVGFFSLFNKMIEDQGGVYELGNIIKTGAISGAVSVFVFMVSLLIFFIINLFFS